MTTNISNVNFKQNNFLDITSVKEEGETKKIDEDILKNKEEVFDFINNKIDSGEVGFNKLKPNLTEPKKEIGNIESLIEQLKDGDKLQKNNSISASHFNFLSDEMMSIIGLMIQYLKNMIKKYEASRELGNLFMQIGLDVANKVKNELYKKADIMLNSAISGAAVSMAIHGIGAFTSMKGLGKDMIGSTNKTLILGGLVSSLADPLSKIVDQSIQKDALRIEGDVKVLEARSHAVGQVANNNNDIQREALDIIKALVQAMDAIIRANQDAASSIAGNVRG